jgi:GNAT superfamily N-acetyltransferase
MCSKLPRHQIAIREARESDATNICEVLIRSVREVCGPDYNNDEAVLEEWCANKKPEIVTDWIRNTDNLFVVAELSPGLLVGAAMYQRVRGSIQLCYLVPEALYQGIGAQLLATLESDAARLGHKEIQLVSSITARHFYRRHGYLDYGEPVYSRGKVLGFPMRRPLAS